MVRAGELKHKLVFRAPVDTNTDGNVVTTYPSIAFTCRGAIDWGAGKRFESAKQHNADVQLVITIRYRAGVLPEHRIEYYDFHGKVTRYFYILSITQSPYHELIISCREQLD